MEAQAEFKCTCGNPVSKHNVEYDAFFCDACDAWIEPKCNSFDCPYCKDRPARPSLIVEVGDD